MERGFLYLSSIHPDPTSWGYPLSISPLACPFLETEPTQGRQVPSLLWGKEGMNLGAVRQGSEMATHLETTKPLRRAWRVRCGPHPSHPSVTAPKPPKKTPSLHSESGTLNTSTRRCGILKDVYSFGFCRAFLQDLEDEKGECCRPLYPTPPSEAGLGFCHPSVV